MADEFIRYNRIKSFMLQPQTYLSFGNIGYNLKENEIILIQSLLTQEYFEGLVPANINKYAHFSSYDEVEPIKTQVYENDALSLEEAANKKNDKVCEKVINDKIISSIWNPCFPDNYKEIEYSKYNFCTFKFIIDLIEKRTGEKFTISQIKNQLYDEYKKYLAEYMDKIVDILILEGKKTLGDQVQAQTIAFSNFIYTDNYFLTTLDIWLLVVKYQIPTIFISQKTILQTNNEKTEFVAYGNREDDFAFVILPGFRAENIPGYKVIISNEDDIFIPLNKLNENCVDRIHNAIENQTTITTYLQEFIKPKKTTYIKKKPSRPIIVDSDSEDTPRPKVQRKKKIIVEEDIADKDEPVEKKTAKKQSRKKQSKEVKDKKSSTKKLRKVSITILETP